MSLSAQFLLMFGLYLAIFVSFTILKTTTIPDVHESARDVLKACFTSVCDPTNIFYLSSVSAFLIFSSNDLLFSQHISYLF